jgi:hypothetical protein
MQHTVIGLFDTYMQAEAARDTLVQTGFAREKVELQASAEPSVGSATSEVANAGVLANIERFLASLFSTGPRAGDTARYAEAMRRGAVLVCVHAASESHAELARNTLVRLGATDIGDRLPEVDTPAPTARDHSVLDELGIGAVMPGTPRTASVTTEAGARPGMRDTTAETGGAAGAAGMTESTGIAGATGATSATGTSSPDTMPTPATPRSDPVADPLAGDTGRSALAAGSVPGSGAVMQPADIVPEGGQPGTGPGAQMPNEYLEYEEDFRTHYDEQYSDADARYEDYVPAYRYGAEIGRDARFRDRPWEEIEPEARRYWETTSPDSTWERFKLAVRHGWERVTGHHHV